MLHSLCRRAEVCKDGEHAAVRLGIRVEAELEEDLLNVRLDCSLGHKEPSCDRLVGKSFGN
jgi:hypothetical protein